MTFRLPCMLVMAEGKVSAAGVVVEAARDGSRIVRLEFDGETTVAVDDRGRRYDLCLDAFQGAAVMSAKAFAVGEAQPGAGLAREYRVERVDMRPSPAP